ncbi:MAG: hypothetical protein VKK59_01150 [Vampirovibrionales bacterium]|nr:hypothetical protein [Vampirovibrionales bacterium]
MGFWDAINPFNWFRTPSNAFDPMAQRQRFFEQQEQLYNSYRPPGSPDYRTLLAMGIRPPVINPMLGMAQGPAAQNTPMALLPNFNSNVNNMANLGTPTGELMALLGTTDCLVANVQQSLAAQRMAGMRPNYA